MESINTNYYANKIIKFIKHQYVFITIITIMLYIIQMKISTPIFDMESINYSYEILPQKIFKFKLNEDQLERIKQFYLVVSFIGIAVVCNNIFERFLSKLFSKERTIKWYDVKIPKYPYDKEKFQYIIGLVHQEESLDLKDKPEYEVIEEDGLFQNIINIGTIGQGKTISFLVQFALQMIYYQHDNPEKKCAMLFLDVKGNFYKFVHAFAMECGRWQDIITLEIGGKWKYNPLHKPNLSAMELANRMRYIMELFTGSDSNNAYWIGMAENTITELIKLIRVYNDGYVNFEELHKMGTKEEYRTQKMDELQEKFDENKLDEKQKSDFESAKDFFNDMYNKLKQDAQGFIVSEITLMTQPFISTKEVKEIFCPSKEEISFSGFEDVIKEGKIVVWKINANKEPKVAKLIAAYLKLDNQKEIMISLEKADSDPISAKRYKVTACDEYQTYVTRNDAEFLSQSREPRSVTAVCTQSYSSLKEVLNNKETTNMLLQSFVNKIWMRSDDEETVRTVMNHIGKEDKERVSTSISESSQKSRVSFSIGKILDKGKNLSTSSSISVQKDFRFDEYFLMQVLDAYKAVCFISTGKKIKKTKVVHLSPLFEGRIIKDKNSKKIKFITTEKEIFENIGKVDFDKVENQTVNDISQKDLLDINLAMGFVEDEANPKNKIKFIQNEEQNQSKKEKNKEIDEEGIDEFLFSK